MSAPAPIYQHPLAYLIGLQGIALMKAFAGEFDDEFVRARLEATRRMLEVGTPYGEGRWVPPMPFQTGYQTWASRYDGEENGYFALEEQVVGPLLASLPSGVAVDVCCGTGRRTATLVELGHQVRGYDASPHMLAHARESLPDVEFAEAMLDDLPVADGSADLVTCFLALTHVEDLAPVFCEFARILKPGGHLVISDGRNHYLGSGRYPLCDLTPEASWAYIPGWQHSTASYLRAALDHGLRVRDCRELMSDPQLDPDEPPSMPEDPDDLVEIWDLHTWDPVATWAAKKDQPAMIVWHFQRDAATPAR